MLDLLAESNMRVSRFDSASRLLRPLIGARPGDVNRALLAAAALVRGGDDAAALAVIERLTRHAPSAQAGWMELSVLQRRLARFDEAIASARHAVALD
ncbi:MAG: hypothetical protein FJX57_09155 [Alphaproteobacteria bacterium]|nr:hypothetical protein [Alphaproteobacteria bacterium]